MTGKEVFKIWAPVWAKWIDWVRPVPFIAINNKKVYEPCDFTLEEIVYIKDLMKDTAIIIDTPNYNSIKEGITLAKLGFRPIPLFNGTNEQEGAMAIVDNSDIESSLIWGATELKNIKLSDDAPPVFLLDSNRMHRFRMNVSVFDNSWDIYDQDIPTAEYFLKNGIKKIIVKGPVLNKDLKVILYKFQKKGMEIFYTKGNEEPKKVVLNRFVNMYKNG